MPKRTINPVLDRTPADNDFVYDENNRIDDLIDAAYDATGYHPDLDYARLDPDARVASLDPDLHTPAWAPDVMLQAIKHTPAGNLKAKGRRETVEGLILGLRKAGFEIVGVEQRERERSEVNANLLLVASGACTLARSPDGRLVLVRQWPHNHAAPPAPEPAAPAEEEEEPEPDVNAMLGMMGNLPPLVRAEFEAREGRKP